MQIQHFALCAAAALATAAPVQAANFTQADSLRQLPPAVQQLLGAGAGTAGDDAIADRGQPFNAGCLLRDKVPRKRFLLGAQNGDTVLVAVEFGGIAHVAQLLSFHRSGTAWQQGEPHPLHGFPKTLEDLLAQQPRPALPTTPSTGTPALAALD